MTRLKTEWIDELINNIMTNEQRLIDLTGYNYLEFAAHANHLSQDAVKQAGVCELVAVVPITSGLGVIGRFSESVAAIIRQAGFNSFVTENTDIDGLYESRARNATMVFFADDNRFLGWHFSKNIISDNNISTARGYVEALECAAGSLNDKATLILGCGVVGYEIAKYLKSKNAIPIIYDKNHELMKRISIELDLPVLKNIMEIKSYDLIMDATSEGEWIHKGMLQDKAWISSPGVPLSLDDEMKVIYEHRIIHDQLDIGTLTMLGELCR
ncbi:MAG: 3-methylornithyl-N6-L-lysine dehydrogenase PylD [Eubacteriales bacterium]|nr:3-methylornithyl-N6-L-lysine dehydrogenase PylD [Eubacteriales bacterium]